MHVRHLVSAAVAALLLSACVNPFGVQEGGEASAGGTEMLSMVSAEPVFYDSAAGASLVEATLVVPEPARQWDGPSGDAVPGSLDVIGRSGELVAARWKQVGSDGSVMNCEGWADATGSSSGCWDEVAGDERPLLQVEFEMTCRPNQPPETWVYTLDSQLVALRFDLADGTSLVAADPDGLGMLALTARQGIVAALAQSVDGVVYVIDSVTAGALCPALN